MGQLTDLTYLNNFSGGDKDFVKEMITLFVESVPEELKKLQEAIRQQDWQKAYMILHPLKTNINFMGIASIKEKVLKAEQLAKHKQETASIPELVEEINKVCLEAVTELRQNLQNS